jgi:hypothetical protein
MSVASIAADQRLAEAVRRLRDVYAPERIYLFGSRARGDDGPDRLPIYANHIHPHVQTIPIVK